ncbi:MAG: hypothetical protein AAGB93_15755 [Planctomycetota bacterium]
MRGEELLPAAPVVRRACEGRIDVTLLVGDAAHDPAALDPSPQARAGGADERLDGGLHLDRARGERTIHGERVGLDRADHRVHCAGDRAVPAREVGEPAGEGHGRQPAHDPIAERFAERPTRRESHGVPLDAGVAGDEAVELGERGARQRRERDEVRAGLLEDDEALLVVEVEAVVEQHADPRAGQRCDGVDRRERRGASRVAQDAAEGGAPEGFARLQERSVVPVDRRPSLAGERRRRAVGKREQRHAEPVEHDPPRRFDERVVAGTSDGGVEPERDRRAKGRERIERVAETRAVERCSDDGENEVAST